LKGTHQLLVYADDVNIVNKNIKMVNKKTEAILEASKEVGLEVNTEETKNMVMSGHQNAGQKSSFHDS